MTLGQRLKAARKKLGISAYRMAKNLGTSQMTISLWERDINRPRAFYLRVIAEAYGLKVEQLENFILHNAV